MSRYGMMLSAFALVAGLGTLLAAEVEAQTARDLNCKKCVGTGDIGKGAVTKSRLKNNAVTGKKIKDGTVTTGKLAGGAVKSDKLAPGAVTSDMLAPGAVTSNKLAPGAIDLIDLGLAGQICPAGKFLIGFDASGDIVCERLPLLNGSAPSLPGDLVITEIMVNPTAAPDPDGEWFEITNRTSVTLNLNGVEFRDSGMDGFVADDTLEIPPGGFAVLARNGDSAMNGGVVADFVYSNFLLGNNGDAIEILSGQTVIDRVAYDPDFDEPGLAQGLDPSATDPILNDDLANWCDATAADILPGGDAGSPGFANTPCL